MRDVSGALRPPVRRRRRVKGAASAKSRRRRAVAVARLNWVAIMVHGKVPRVDSMGPVGGVHCSGLMGRERGAACWTRLELAGLRRRRSHMRQLVRVLLGDTSTGVSRALVSGISLMVISVFAMGCASHSLM